VAQAPALKDQGPCCPYCASVDPRDILFRVIGWRALVFHGDAFVMDRWNWLSRHLRRGRVRTLDAGCGNGAFSCYAATLGNEVVGISYEPEAIQRAEARVRRLGYRSVRFMTADLRRIDDWGPALGSFDQIICCETIEHIRDDLRVLRGLAALLRPGGQLLLTVPSRLAPPLPGDHVSSEEDGGHVRWGYTAAQLVDMLTACGLVVCDISGINECVSRTLVAIQRIVAAFAPHVAWAVVLPLRPLRVLDNPLTRWRRVPWYSLAVVALTPSR
jgi:SAM-dependent methyltransferase